MVKSNGEEIKNMKPLDPKIDEWEEKLSLAILLNIKNEWLKLTITTKHIKEQEILSTVKAVKRLKQKTSVRKVAFELVESQIDTTIPQPKVTSVKGNYDRAQTIEHFLKNELDRLPFEEINDEQSRITPIAGASIFLVEWDNSVKTRNTIGKLVVNNIHPNEIIPQPGVYKIQNMDYWFFAFITI